MWREKYKSRAALVAADEKLLIKLLDNFEGRTTRSIEVSEAGFEARGINCLGLRIHFPPPL